VREQRLAIVTVSCVALCILFLLIVRPLLSEWEQLDLDIRTKTEHTELLKAILEKEQEVNANFEQYRKLLAQQSTDEVVRNELMQDINTISARSDLKAPVIREGSTESYKFYKRYFVDLDIEGAVANLGRFLANLQESTKLFRVESLTVTRKFGPVLQGRMEISKILVPGAPKDAAQEAKPENAEAPKNAQPTIEQPPQETHEQNLIVNGDFELWSAGWGANKYPDGWTGYRVTTARETARVVSGFAAASFQGELKGSGVVQEVRVRPWTRYQITCHAALLSGSVSLRVRDIETGQFFKTADVPVKGQDMRLYSQTFAAVGDPDGPDRTVVFQMHFHEPNSTVCIDDVRMVQIESGAQETKQQ
jgi:Tfp pilus assembly protein PilO